MAIFSLLFFKDGVEPIWATAAKNDVTFATFLWGRCDIPYDGVKRYSPAKCESYYTADRTKTLTINVDNAMQHLMNGVDAAIVSYRHHFIKFLILLLDRFMTRHWRKLGKTLDHFQIKLMKN